MHGINTRTPCKCTDFNVLPVSFLLLNLDEKYPDVRVVALLITKKFKDESIQFRTMNFPGVNNITCQFNLFSPLLSKTNSNENSGRSAFV